MIADREVNEIVWPNLEAPPGMIKVWCGIIEQGLIDGASGTRGIAGDKDSHYVTGLVRGAVMRVDESVGGEIAIEIHAGQSAFEAGVVGREVHHGFGLEISAANHAQPTGSFGEKQSSVGRER